LISDIHCNLAGLQEALALLADCDEVLCAGDLMYQYRFSNDVLRHLAERRVHAIVGNHDKTILYTPGFPLRTSPSVDPERLGYLAGLPHELMLTLDGIRIAMFHGAPWDDPRGTSASYLYPDDEQQLRRLAQVEADVIVLGHTHRAFAKSVDEVLVVNPGSCGEARDGTRNLTCAILDTASREVEFRLFSN
jgi:putative phosphoesterase